MIGMVLGVIPYSAYYESVPTAAFNTNKSNGIGYLWVGDTLQYGIFFAFHGGTEGVTILDKLGALDASGYFTKTAWGNLTINAQYARLWITGY